MLIHRHDEPLTDAEWRDFLKTHDFGDLIVPGAPTRDLPVVVPTHFIWDGDKTVLLHLARINPVWKAIEERPRALLSVSRRVRLHPGHWDQDSTACRPDTTPAVQLACDIEPIDDDAAHREDPRQQLDHSSRGEATRRSSPATTRMPSKFPAIRGLRLTVTDVRAKFKFGGNRTTQHREAVAQNLGERDSGLDKEARAYTLTRGEKLKKP